MSHRKEKFNHSFEVWIGRKIKCSIFGKEGKDGKFDDLGMVILGVTDIHSGITIRDGEFCPVGWVDLSVQNSVGTAENALVALDESDLIHRIIIDPGKIRNTKKMGRLARIPNALCLSVESDRELLLVFEKRHGKK